MAELTEVLTTVQQWGLFCGVVMVVGCVAWRGVVATRASARLPQEESRALKPVERRVASIGVFSVLALVGVWVLRMVVQVMAFRDPFVPLREDVSFLLFETFWGTVWMAQGFVLPLLAAAFWLARGPARPWAWWGAGALTLALVATLALSSHAMGVESGRSLIVTADAIHTLAAGTWIGSLGIILAVGRGTGSNDRLFSAQLLGFSPMALTSVAALTGMGVVLAWTHLTTLSDLWTTGYGRVLSAKIGVVGLVFLAGFWNWKRGLQTLDTPGGVTAVHRRATLEVALAVGVLILTAVLVHSAKPS